MVPATTPSDAPVTQPCGCMQRDGQTLASSPSAFPWLNNTVTWELVGDGRARKTARATASPPCV